MTTDGSPIQGNRFAKNLRIANKTPLPDTLANNYDSRTARKVLLRRKCAPSENRYAPATEKICRRLNRPPLLHSPATRVIHHARRKGRDDLNHVFPARAKARISKAKRRNRCG